MFALAAGLVIVVLALRAFSTIGQRHRPIIKDRDHRLEIDVTTVIHHSPDTPSQASIIDTLYRVAAETNNLGPFENDIFATYD
jgi:hypothetical protein